jgi:Ca2+:H+ antiporter
VEDVTHPYAMAAVFLWLFLGVLWSAISVVRHADCLALKSGEPYGTLILTLSAITIEVMMISAAMLHGANNPTLARDMMLAVIMIALNGLVGLSLLLGGLRYREQHYNIQGTNASRYSGWSYRTIRRRCPGQGFRRCRNSSWSSHH